MNFGSGGTRGGITLRVGDAPGIILALLLWVGCSTTPADPAPKSSESI